jgi:DNA-binding response OmpR family regulator
MTMRDGKPLILCVDDDADLLDLLRMQLEKGGYAVDTAFTAEEGLLKFKQNQPEIIIVDLPIFMLSSMGDQLDVSTGYRQLGLDGVFQKPVNAEALLRTIKAKLAR